ncbi:MULTISPECIES: CapA family protein [Photorhabdus]|uniref:Capsule synthesis protein CapA domain-containing protein n=4 Tax=Photorhabdus TaxID=29487 RepID=A0ABX0ASH3_9GAMM|nr:MULTISPECIES: CapA family protein [Photorhabdus]MCC8373713.1 CapA family protein [Photorhabdus bodei]MCC8463757.1 CapA family protein [Photorhabdus bodei]MDB6368822.1 CapA family protein [Photorhabdus bodei]MDB6371046.1 CapA family protein [Photorhabdus bodei]NDL10403.1 hypothetical protein [Photorhabdus kayaii]
MSSITIASFGDVLINREDPASAFSHMTSLVENADIVIGNYEGVLTDRPEPIPGRRGMTISSVKNAKGVALFDVLSLANNHAMDSGLQGLTDTLKALHSVGVQTTGAGLTFQQAWKPALIECRGIRVAVFGVTGIYYAGTEAGSFQGGVAALRSRDYYSPPFSGAVVPGALPDIMTVINEDDWAHFSCLVGNIRSQADFIIAAMHWGDHTRKDIITRYEKEISKRLSQCGVNLVIGHHHHSLRGVEWHKNMLTCFGLGNLIFDQPLSCSINEWSKTGFQLPDYARYTAAILTRCSPNEILSAHLLPLYIEADTPVPVSHGSDEWHAFLRIMRRCARQDMTVNHLVDNGTRWGDFTVLDIIKPISDVM